MKGDLVNAIELLAVLGVAGFIVMTLYEKYQANQASAAATAQFNAYLGSVQDEGLIATLGQNPFQAPAGTVPVAVGSQ